MHHPSRNRVQWRTNDVRSWGLRCMRWRAADWKRRSARAGMIPGNEGSKVELTVQHPASQTGKTRVLPLTSFVTNDAART
eukprot:2801973-Rhodomonas_salina.3